MHIYGVPKDEILNTWVKAIVTSDCNSVHAIINTLKIFWRRIFVYKKVNEQYCGVYKIRSYTCESGNVNYFILCCYTSFYICLQNYATLAADQQMQMACLGTWGYTFFIVHLTSKKIFVLAWFMILIHMYITSIFLILYCMAFNWSTSATMLCISTCYVWFLLDYNSTKIKEIFVLL